LDILFKTKRLERCYLALDEGSRVYGPIVARKYVQRINIIKATSNFSDLGRLPSLRLHPLKGQLKGSWAIDLHDRYRLIFSLEGKNLEIALIEEVSNHYGD
jgi:toxin HigB-1